MTVPPKERWFDDYTEGETFEFGDHLVTEGEIIDFARRYDPQPFHLDHAAAAATHFGGLVGSGWMSCAIMMRLLCDHFISTVSSMGSPGIDQVRWLRPVRPGDRLRARVTVATVRASQSRPDRGIVGSQQELLNQRGEVVMTLSGNGFYLRRPTPTWHHPRQHPRGSADRMKLVLVRHGRPDEDDPERPHDPPLRADGWVQARAVARHLAGEGITHVVASPLHRAQQTALPLAEALKLPVITIDGWAEADRATSRYRSTETLRALDPASWQRFVADPVRYLGSDPDRFRADVLGALQQTLQLGGSASHVVVFAHGLPINLVLSHALDLPRITHFHPGYGSITRLRVRAAGAIGVVSINESGHHERPQPLRQAAAGTGP